MARYRTYDGHTKKTGGAGFELHRTHSHSELFAQCERTPQVKLAAAWHTRWRGAARWHAGGSGARARRALARGARSRRPAAPPTLGPARRPSSTGSSLHTPYHDYSTSVD